MAPARVAPSDTLRVDGETVPWNPGGAGAGLPYYYHNSGGTGSFPPSGQRPPVITTVSNGMQTGPIEDGPLSPLFQGFPGAADQVVLERVPGSAIQSRRISQVPSMYSRPPLVPPFV
ncbi:hypothetical protein PDE_01438 [Penicillium oxalicum 114-2]|uniref:Uncharacterized protein n=1 Tax=Penicillium oxalicum (strain 114-2 / CGMCC 5302) TaxID=933388 RepID=S7ZCT1_PENO1|nr:hypothetical protein PDE_01438 [Penicillium oxalicum 114-2]